MLKTARFVLSFQFVALLFSGCDGPVAGKWKGSMRSDNGVKIVENPKDPIYKETNSDFEHEFTIAESDSSGSFNLVGIASILVDPQGNIYALDSRDSNIKVFSSTGQYLKTIGRYGNGPGELLSPVYMDLLKSAELVVHDPQCRRLTYFGLNGDYKRSISTAKISMGEMKIDSAGNIYSIVLAFKDGKRRFELQKFDSNLNYLCSFDCSDFEEGNKLTLFIARPSFTIDKDGIIWFGQPELEYELKGYSNVGILVKRIQKAYTPSRIPKAEIDMQTRGIPEGLEVNFPGFYSPYYDIDDDDDGRIMVLTCVYFKDNTYIFDVFDNEGKYIETKHFRPGCKASRFRWTRDRMYVVEEEESGLLAIKVYRVKRNG